MAEEPKTTSKAVKKTKKATAKKTKPIDQAEQQQTLIELGKAIVSGGGEQWMRAALAQKKNQVIDAVDGVIKTGQAPNAIGGYKYVEEREIIKLIRTALTSNGISIGVSMEGLQGEPISRAVGSRGVLYFIYNVLFHITLTDCETGHAEMFIWIGQGDDPSDKAINKAATSAIKYFLLKNFLVPTGDDAEQFATPGGEKDDGKQSAGDQSAGDQAVEADQPPSSADGLPEYTHKNTGEIMQALADFYRTQDTENYKFNLEKFRAAVFGRFKKWPTSQPGAKKIRSEILHLDVSDESK